MLLLGCCNTVSWHWRIIGIVAVAVWFVAGYPGRADSFLPQVSPIEDIVIRIGEKDKVLARVTPGVAYPLVKETAQHYLILFRYGTNTTIGLLPVRDQIGNPVAYPAKPNDPHLNVRTGIHAFVYQGSIPFDANERYDVVCETGDYYKVRFSIEDFSMVCELSKTSVVYFSEALLKVEREQGNRVPQIRRPAIEQKKWLEEMELRQKKTEMLQIQEARKAAREERQREKQAELMQKQKAEAAEREMKMRALLAEREKQRQAESIELARQWQAKLEEQKLKKQLAEAEKLEVLRRESLIPIDISPTELRSCRPVTNIVIRAKAKLDDYYSWELCQHVNRNEYLSVRLLSADNDGIGTGYITLADRGKDLSPLLSSSTWTTLLFRISYPRFMRDPGVFFIHNYQEATK